jgi:dolichol kinase
MASNTAKANNNPNPSPSFLVTVRCSNANPRDMDDNLIISIYSGCIEAALSKYSDKGLL